VAGEEDDLEAVRGFVEDGRDAGETGGVGVGEDVVQDDKLPLVVEGDFGKGHADGEMEFFAFTARDFGCWASFSFPR
jgi:hypothetical protein